MEVRHSNSGHRLSCFNPDIGLPFVCTTDEQCAQGWRCGLEGRCVDSRAEALRADAQAGALSKVLVSPAPGPAPELFSSGDQVKPLAFEDAYQLFAEVKDGGLETVMLFANWQPQFDAGHGPAVRSFLPLTTQPVSSLGVAGTRAYLLDRAGLGVFDWSLDGGALRRATGGGSLRGQMRVYGHAPNDVGPARVFGIEARSYWVYDPDGDLVQTSTIRGMDGGALALYDVVAGDEQQGNANYYDLGFLLAATEEGLYGAYFDGGTLPAPASWAPAQFRGFPNAQCPPQVGAPALRATRLDSWGPHEQNFFYRTLLLWGAPIAGSADAGLHEPLGLMEYSGYPPINACGFGNNFFGFGVCSGCPEGDKLVDAISVRSSFNSIDATAITFCRAPNGSQRAYRITTRLDVCTREEQSFEDADAFTLPTTPSHVPMGTTTQLGARGQRWSVTGSTSSPLTLDMHPAPLFKNNQELWGIASVSKGFAQTAFAHLQVDGVGLVRSGGAPRAKANNVEVFPAGTVEGNLRWAFDNSYLWNFNGSDPRPVASFSASVLDPQNQSSSTPRVAVLARTSDGGTSLVAAFSDKIAAADLTAALGDGGAPELALKFSPRPFSPIRSLTALLPTQQADGGGSYVSGYALTETGLFFFAASSEQRWRAQEVIISGDEPLEVWADRAAGRIGFADGTVVSLPSRVLLANGLPNGERALDFAQLCGQPFAISGSALYRLGGADGGAADWELEALPISLSGTTPLVSEVPAAKLWSDRDELYVSTRFGEVVRIRPVSPCP